MQKILDKLPPAVLLYYLAPVFGELFSGSSPLDEYLHPVTFLILTLLYGGGAVIIRELAVRWQTGWRGILLLGFAYGIYEEGVIVQSFFDPSWMDLGSLAVYGRVAGVNWVWTQHLLIFHAVISILASITFVEILYPQWRNEPWVNHRGWWVAIWIGFLAVYILWEFMTTYDPGVWRLVCWVAILLLVLAARRTKTTATRLNLHKAPTPFWLWLLGFLAAFGNFFIVYSGADAGRFPFPVAMLLLVIYDLLFLQVILKYSRRQFWGDTHRIALICGALSFFLVFTIPSLAVQHPIVYFTNPLFLLLLWLVVRHVKGRPSQSVVGA